MTGRDAGRKGGERDRALTRWRHALRSVRGRRACVGLVAVEAFVDGGLRDSICPALKREKELVRRRSRVMRWATRARSGRSISLLGT